MADIELVIKIPEEMYKWVYDANKFTYYGTSDFIDLVKNGTPLPKGHGRLIDADDAKREWSNVIDCEIEHPKYQCTIRDVLEDAPTIISADKEIEI